MSQVLSSTYRHLQWGWAGHWSWIQKSPEKILSSVSESDTKVAGVFLTLRWKYESYPPLLCFCLGASLVAQWERTRLPMQKTWVQSLGWEEPLERVWQPTSVFLPGKSHGQQSLEGYGPGGHKRIRRSDLTTATTDLILTPAVLFLRP